MLEILIENINAKLEGNSVGSWITLPMDEDELIEEINEILRRGEILSKSENLHDKYEIKEYKWDENICEIFSIDTNANIYDINNDLTLIEEETQPYEHKKIKFLLENNYANNIENAIEKVDEVSIFEHMSMEAVARIYIDEQYNLDEIPKIISNNIDYARIGKNLEQEYGYTVVGPNVFYYQN